MNFFQFQPPRLTLDIVLDFFNVLHNDTLEISYHQERIKGTEKASPIYTLFHR